MRAKFVSCNAQSQLHLAMPCRGCVLLLLAVHSTAAWSVTSCRGLRASTRPRHATPPQLLAKKKGGGGKKGAKGGKGGKQSGFAWASSFELKPFESAALREMAEQGCRTYQTRTGQVLDAILQDAADLPKVLWSLPVAFVIVGPSAEAKEASGDPPPEAPAEDEPGAADAPAAAAAKAVYLYANLAAVEALGFGDWQSCIGAVAELPEEMAEKYQSGYQKKVGKKKVMLLDAARWAIEKAAVEDGKLVTARVGLCYAWREWEDADGMICEPGGKRRQPDPTLEEMGAALEAQGAEVRRLKEEEGLGNQDPQVKAAVAELLRLKALAEELQAA